MVCKYAYKFVVYFIGPLFLFLLLLVVVAVVGML